MGLYAKYVKEREGFDFLENEKGFYEYKITGDDCYIRSIFIAPEFRSTGAAKDLAFEVISIAKKAGCKTLTGTVIPSLNKEHASISLSMQLKFGFKLESSHEDLIILKMEI